MCGVSSGKDPASRRTEISHARAIEVHGERPPTRLGIQQHVIRLMADLRWVRGVTDRELAEAWGARLDQVQQWSAEASRHLTLLRERDVVLDRVRLGADSRLDHAEDRDFVQVARLLVDTVGGFDQKLSVNMQVSAKPDAEIIAGTIRELVASDETREQVRKALAEWDSGATSGVAMITEGSEVGGT